MKPETSSCKRSIELINLYLDLPREKERRCILSVSGMKDGIALPTSQSWEGNKGTI